MWIIPSIAQETGTLVDTRDGITYGTVKIGDQWWMAENLAWLPSVSPSSEGSDTENYYYVYDYNGNDIFIAKATDNYATYGVLYNWEASKIACPEGWHLPNNAEWTILTDYAGGTNVAGDRLKETGTNHWRSPNAGATDEYSFTALPAGGRHLNELFNDIGCAGFWWSSSELNTSNAWYYYIGCTEGDVDILEHRKLNGFSVRCLQDPPPTTPTVATTDITNITINSAESGGNVTDDGGSIITARGVCWSSRPNPDINDDLTDDGTGTGTFISSLTGLTTKTTYFLRAYATNSVGTEYGDQINFQTIGSFSDSRDGNIYEYEAIGIQTWMAENLAYLPSVNPPNDYSDSEIHYYVHDYNGTSVTDAKEIDKYKTYGVLYNWEAAKTACPIGWHLPSDDEWKILEEYLGMSLSDVNKSGERSSGDVGMKLKSTSGWYNNGNGDNRSGFNAYPGGWYSEPDFGNLPHRSFFWSSSPYGSIYAWNRYMSYYSDGVYRYNEHLRRYGLSVRCVKESATPVNPTVTTANITNITINSADGGGNITNDGGATVTARGVCWSSSPNPDINDDLSDDGTGIGTFTSSLTGLTSNTTYYVRAFSINSSGTAYGNEISFTTNIRTLHVSKSGSNITGDGSLEKPFNSIQHAIDLSVNEETIIVQPGTYSENINFNGKNIIVASQIYTTGDESFIQQTIIDGSQNGSVVTFNNAENSTAKLYGFSITNGLTTNTHGAGIAVEHASPTLEYLDIYGNISDGWNAGGIYLLSSDAIISNVIIRNNEAVNGGGISTWNDSNPSLTNVLIMRNTASNWGGGIAFSGYQKPICKNLIVVENTAKNGGGFVCSNNMVLINSTIANNSATTYSGAYYYGERSPIIINSIIYDNVGNNEFNVEPENSLIAIYSNISGGYNGTGNIDIDPRFSDFDTGDYHLSKYSPTIGAGIESVQIEETWYDSPNSDFDANPRPNPVESNPDMGAFENILANSTPKKEPEITTTIISNITYESANGGGNVIDDGGDDIIVRGICWSTNDDPTVEDQRTLDGPGKGEFISVISNLYSNTTYYVRSYATNSIGTAYGDHVSFRTYGSITDSRDDKIYKTILIGDQWWMAENLNYGIRINNEVNKNQTNNGIDEKYCYDDDESYCDTYGGLYQWPEVMSYSIQEGVRGLCPEGWHIPTDIEWIHLENYFGMENPEAYQQGWRDSGEVGNKLKSTTGWTADGNGNNSSRLYVLPAGFSYDDANFYNILFNSYFWTSTEYNGNPDDAAWARTFHFSRIGSNRGAPIQKQGFSVRCVLETGKTIPSINTLPITNITSNSAQTGGDAIDNGGLDITARGVCWSTNKNPNFGDNHTVDGSGLGSFTSSLTDLIPKTIYFVRSYATNAAGTVWGGELSFTTKNNDASLSDIKMNANTISGFTPTDLSYDIELPFRTQTVPTITATANDQNASIVINNKNELPGTTTIEVTAEDGTTILTYSINLTVVQKPNYPDWTNPTGGVLMDLHCKVIVFEGDYITSDGSLIAAFKDGEVRGVTQIFNGPVGKQFLLKIIATLYYEPGISFKVYDFESDMVFPVKEIIDFLQNSTEGSIIDPLIFHAGYIEQKIPIVTGWSWISFNTIPEDNSLAIVLGNYPGMDNDAIKTAPALGGSATYYGGTWYGLNGGILPGIMYLLNSQSGDPGELSIYGFPVDVSTPILIVENWNWIGYNPQEVLDLGTALASLSSVNNDEIKTTTHMGGTATFYEGAWYGLDEGLKPGMGYLLKSSKADELIYPGGSISEPSIPGISSNGIKSANNIWANPTGKRYTMTVHAKLQVLGGGFLEAPGSKLAAFKNNECCGVFELFDGPTGKQFQLSVASDLENEADMIYMAYDATKNKIYEINENLDFEFNTTLGRIQDPVYLTVGAVLGIDEYLNKSKSIEFKLYPNPFNNILNINFTTTTNEKIQIAIFDTFGRKVRILENKKYQPGSYNLKWNGHKLPNGIYFIRMETDGYISNLKIVKMN